MKARLFSVWQSVFVFAIMAMTASCHGSAEVEKQECGQVTIVNTIHFNLDTLLSSQIKDFCLLGDSTFVLTDGASIYKANRSGEIVKRINTQGHGRKEYLSIGNLFSDGNYLYAWCVMSLQLYKYDRELNYIEQYKGPTHAIAKFIVTESDSAYFLLSGGYDEVLCSMPLKDNANPQYSGCYTFEDKALLFNGRSGGLAAFGGQVYYVKPAEMTILNAGNDNAWTYSDKEFCVEAARGNLTEWNPDDRIHYIFSNSTCTGLYADVENLWLTTETGSLQLEEDGRLKLGTRFLNVFKIDDRGNVVSSCKYDLPMGIAHKIFNGCLYLLAHEEFSCRIDCCPL